MHLVTYEPDSIGCYSASLQAADVKRSEMTVSVLITARFYASVPLIT